MGIMDWLLGKQTETPERGYVAQHSTAPAPNASLSDDERAVERYRYLLRTASPDTVERVHAEAFAKMTDSQRQAVFDELKANAPYGDAPVDSSPQNLALSATRSELRQPGTLERSFGTGSRDGMGFGATVASSLLGTVAGYVVGSALVSALFPTDLSGAEASGDADTDASGNGTDAASADSGTAEVGGSESFDSGSSDFGGFDAGGFGDFGDLGF